MPGATAADVRSEDGTLSSPSWLAIILVASTCCPLSNIEPLSSLSVFSEACPVVQTRRVCMSSWIFFTGLRFGARRLRDLDRVCPRSEDVVGPCNGAASSFSRVKAFGGRLFTVLVDDDEGDDVQLITHALFYR